MGCWDEFCFICGNPCHSFDESIIYNIEDLYNDQMGKKKRDKYYEDIFKKIDKDKKYIEKMFNFVEETEWLNKCIFLTTEDKIIMDCREINCNNTFEDKKGNQYFQDIKYESIDDISLKGNNGIFLHDDCWKFIKKNYNIELKFSDVALSEPPKPSRKMNHGMYYKYNYKINYGKIEKYWSQDFKFQKLFMDSNQFMSISPLKNSKNGIRIKKIISQYKFNSDKSRKGPAVSATFYPENTIKYGINGLLWIKKKGKWNELKDSNERRKIKIDYSNLSSKQIEYLEKLVCFGQQTLIPIVIMEIKKLKGNKTEIELQGEMEEFNKFDKLHSNGTLYKNLRKEYGSYF